MAYFSSQEDTIYRSLAGQIQLGFYDDERFPSAKEVARRYQVSYCPAQRALKKLEKSSLIQLCRGKETVVLSKPYENFLESGSFRKRISALIDLNRTLKLISSTICFQGVCSMVNMGAFEQLTETADCVNPVKRFYHLLGQSLRALGSRTILSLFYDIGGFIESAFFDILYAFYEKDRVNLLFQDMTDSFIKSISGCQSGNYAAAKSLLDNMGNSFHSAIEQYLCEIPADSNADQEVFHWDPRKGRTKYCDTIAIDMICKINQGIHPVGAFLPKGDILADIYHVSTITIRRTITLLNKLGVTESINGVGTRVVSTGNESILQNLGHLMMDDNLKSFLEALQLLDITCEQVIKYTFPYFTPESSQAISNATASNEKTEGVISTISACLQAVVHCCPLITIRHIYGVLTLLLLKGSVLRLNKTCENTISGWPEISHALLESLNSGNGTRFASAFRQLVSETLAAMKKSLLKSRVSGTEEIFTPIAFME